MTREVVTYAPVVNGKDSGHFRSFKNAFFTFAGQTEKLRERGVTLTLECRSSKASPIILGFEQVYALAERAGLFRDGKVNFAAQEPSDDMIAEAFAHHASEKAA